MGNFLKKNVFLVNFPIYFLIFIPNVKMRLKATAEQIQGEQIQANPDYL